MISDFTLEELQSATRNHGMPLEALRYDVTSWLVAPSFSPMQSSFANDDHSLGVLR